MNDANPKPPFWFRRPFPYPRERSQGSHQNRCSAVPLPSRIRLGCGCRPPSWPWRAIRGREFRCHSRSAPGSPRHVRTSATPSHSREAARKRRVRPAGCPDRTRAHHLPPASPPAGRAAFRERCFPPKGTNRPSRSSHAAPNPRASNPVEPSLRHRSPLWLVGINSVP